MVKSVTQLFDGIYRRPAFWLSLAAAILYSSWPLGFVFNPGVAHHLLASELEAPHEPFNWVFVSMDVLTGVTVSIIGILQLKAHKRGALLNTSIYGYIAFGVLVALAAVSPLNCNPGTKSCGPLIDDPIVIIHGFASIVSVILLLVSIVVLTPLIKQYIRVSKMVRILFVAMVGCWILFGIGSLLELALNIRGNTLQYYFITVCSISIIFIVSVIEHVGVREHTVLTYKEIGMIPKPESV
jgi:hypothetical protein